MFSFVSRCLSGESLEPVPSWFRRDWFWGSILILFVLLAYAPIWHAGFVWDDYSMLQVNPCIVGPLGLKEIWTTHAADICPFVITTFWVEHALWGLNPLPFHLVNILMHGACAVLLWRVLRRLGLHQGAWLGGALWAVHPVQVESVAWITEMKNTESALFFLLSVLLFVKWLTCDSHGPVKNTRRGRWDYWLSLLFAALAMASKSSTVILPVVLFLCAWWIEGRWNRRTVARVMPMLLLSVAAGAVSIWTQGFQLARSPDPQWMRTWPQRMAGAGDAVWFYLGKLLWPDPLIAIYPRWQIDTAQWLSYLPLLAVILFFAVLWLLMRRSGGAGARACFFAFAYFITALLPALGLIDNYIFRYSLVFDHLQYLASMGPLALAGAGLARSPDIVLQKRLPSLQPALCGALLMILGMASWQRTWAFESDETLWTDAVAKNPNCWAGYYTLANIRVQNGELDQAIEQYQRSIKINPNYARAQGNLGVALFKEGRLDEAIAHYQMALESNPNYAEAHTNLGNALLQKGQLGEATEHYQMALKIDPGYAPAYANLGIAFFRQGRLADAITLFNEALRLNPDLVPVRDSLARAQALLRQK